MEFPVLEDPVVVCMYAGPAVIDNRSVVDMAVVDEVRPAAPDVVHGRAVVAMVGIEYILRRVRWIVTLIMTCAILGRFRDGRRNACLLWR